MSVLLVAHGTRDPAGAAVSEALARRVRDRLPGERVGLAYADVRGPTIADALAGLPGPGIAVPLFLAAGHHVRVDVPGQLHGSGWRIAETLGPAPALARLAVERLRAAGWRSGDAVVLAVAGSNDPAAAADSVAAARHVGRLLGAPVTLATVAAGGPRVPEVVARLRAGGADRVAVASWLLAPGLFQRRLAAAGADVVAAPLGADGVVADLVLDRLRSARSPARTA